MYEKNYIKKTKKFVGCAVKVDVYIASDNHSDLFLNGVNLRLVGKLKNNQTMSFDVPNETTELYVVFSKSMPAIYHRMYEIESGDTDITLYTYPTFNPFAGNPVVITRNEKATLEDKERMKKYNKAKVKSPGQSFMAFALVILSAVVGLIFGLMMASM